MSDNGFSMDRITGSKSTLVVLVGSILALLGSFMTWASFAGQSIGGMGDGRDGTISFIVAILTAGAAVFMKGNPRKWSVVAGAAVILFVAIANMLDINDVGLSIGIGLWMVLIGGVAAAAGAFIKD